MKKLYKIFTSRMFWMVLIFGLQIAAIAVLVFWSAVGKEYYLFFMALSIVMGVIIITRKENNAYRLMWMFVIILFPFLGGVFYLIFANKKIGALSEKKVADFRRRLPDVTEFS
ncbi:MAG: PLD nuclease N-terminal domain-containing protein, partial [Candidatus Ornithospirochaeta sp.]